MIYCSVERHSLIFHANPANSAVQATIDVVNCAGKLDSWRSEFGLQAKAFQAQEAEEAYLSAKKKLTDCALAYGFNVSLYLYPAQLCFTDFLHETGGRLEKNRGGK